MNPKIININTILTQMIRIGFLALAIIFALFAIVSICIDHQLIQVNPNLIVWLEAHIASAVITVMLLSAVAARRLSYKKIKLYLQIISSQ